MGSRNVRALRRYYILSVRERNEWLCPSGLLASRSINMTSSGSLSVKPEPDGADNIYRSLLIVLQIIMVVELAVLLIDRFWLNALLVLAIMALTIVPILLGSRLPVKIPSEFQILTIIFVFASLFLGEVRSYYDRIWWWDLALHASSGLLFGVLGFPIGSRSQRK